MRRIAETINSVPNPTAGPDWHRRIVLGCWSARYLPRCAVTLICVHIGYARQFLQVPGISFNVNQMVLMGPLGRGILEEARGAGGRVYVWTVNSPNLMRWGFRHRVNGVITDHPGRFQRVCEEWEIEHQDESGASIRPELNYLTYTQRLQVLAAALYVLLFGWLLKRKYLASVERVQFEEAKVS